MRTLRATIPTIPTILVTVTTALWLAPLASEHPPEAYRRFAAENPGDAARGKGVFESDKTGCVRCHVVGSEERRAGPDLLGIADKYARPRLVDALLKPGADIVAGYETTVVRTRSGDIVTGIVKERDGDRLDLFDSEGKVRSVTASDIVSEKSDRASLMPEGLEKPLSTAEFADLIAYLETLHRPDAYRLAHPSAPETIRRVEKPVRFVPHFATPLRFDHPVWFEAVPGLEETWVVVENDSARIWLVERRGGTTSVSLFLDLSAEAHQGEHMGLMGLAFHPEFRVNGLYYLNHHFLESGSFGTFIIERRASLDSRRDSGAPSRRLLRIDQPTRIHTGGMVAFGPDGHLYIGTGDGGPQTDPRGHAQSLRRLNGAILRVDVNGRDPGLEYAIPDSNPFAGTKDPRVRREIWASGLRQAWRFSWDPDSGDLWVGDVGQVGFEEITIVRKGENHGWNVYEGFVPFSDRYRRKGVEYVPPVIALGRKHGASITGGAVYRGARSPSWNGVYIFCDYESKRAWGLRQKNRELETVLEIGTAPDRITSFCVGRDGELYALGYDRGVVYRVVLEGAAFE